MFNLYHSLLVSPVVASILIFVNPVVDMISAEKYFFMLLTMALTIDLIMGAAKYLKLHQFSFKNLVIGLLIKVIVSYGGFALLFSFAMLEDGWVSEWFALVARLTVLLYPAGSAITNMYILTDGKFPPIGFMRRLKAFDALVDTVDKE